MHHEDIKAAIRKRGVTPAQIADHLHVSRSLITHVLRGNTRNVVVSTAIAKVIGLSPAEIWPDVYGEEPKSVADILGAGGTRIVDKRRGDRRKAA